MRRTSWSVRVIRFRGGYKTVFRSGNQFFQIAEAFDEDDKEGLATKSGKESAWCHCDFIARMFCKALSNAFGATLRINGSTKPYRHSGGN